MVLQGIHGIAHWPPSICWGSFRKRFMEHFRFRWLRWIRKFGKRFMEQFWKLWWMAATISSTTWSTSWTSWTTWWTSWTTWWTSWMASLKSWPSFRPLKLYRSKLYRKLSTCESSQKTGRRIGCCWLDCIVSDAHMVGCKGSLKPGAKTNHWNWNDFVAISPNNIPVGQAAAKMIIERYVFWNGPFSPTFLPFFLEYLSVKPLQCYCSLHVWSILDFRRSIGKNQQIHWRFPCKHHGNLRVPLQWHPPGLIKGLLRDHGG